MRGALSKEIENGNKMSLDSGLSWIMVFVGGRRNVWVAEQGRREGIFFWGGGGANQERR